jgi:hypothetical protein
VGGRRRTRAELLSAWRHDTEGAAAAQNERAEAEAAARLDAADPLLSGAPVTPDAVVRIWAGDSLLVELRPDDPVPPAITAAFREAQAALWDGAPISGATLLVNEPTASPPTDR